jgi:hypothetical protein
MMKRNKYTLTNGVKTAHLEKGNNSKGKLKVTIRSWE